MTDLLVWDFLEQLAVAALDIGQLELADVCHCSQLQQLELYGTLTLRFQDCIQRLDEQFPKSPRVKILHGMRIETKDLDSALKYYEQMLENEESNAVWCFLNTAYVL